ncbi:DsbC family protein [Rhodocyclaceae bacterium]
MKKFILSILTATVITPVLANTSEVEQRLKDQYPATKITSVRESPAKGIYEVIMGRNVAYTDEAGRYMIFGHLYDMKEQRDLTAGVLEALNKVDMAMLPEADAIKKIQGRGERKMFVFSDPDCPYCKRLESELAKVDNVTIYTLLYPLDGLHPDARRKAQTIWCAKDRVNAWDEFIQKGTLPESRSCDHPIERNIRLGNALGINGTPTIIFEDGAITPGMLPAAEIERRLAGGGRPVGGAAQRVNAGKGD